MVACFSYASIHLHSVFLPPPKLEFNHDTQDWLQKEALEVDKLILVEIQHPLLSASVYEIIFLV